MSNFDSTQQQEQNLVNPQRFLVVGVGRAGVNMLDRIKLNHEENDDLLVMHTNSRLLQASTITNSIQLGEEITYGFGSGGDPQVGFMAAQASLAAFREKVKRRSVVFFCAGLGGGTASGALPLLVQAARDAGAFVVSFVVTPFEFEGERRQKQAQQALQKMKAKSHVLMTFQNSRMKEIVDAESNIYQAFAKLDQLVATAISSISQMTSSKGLMNFGLDKLMAALADNQEECIYGWGEAEGEDRLEKVVDAVLASPLLDRKRLKTEATTVLIHVSGGSDLSIWEVEEVIKKLTKQVNPKAHILCGTAASKSSSALSLTLISSLKQNVTAENGTFSQEAPALTHTSPIQLSVEQEVAESATVELQEQKEVEGTQIRRNRFEAHGEALRQQLESKGQWGYSQAGENTVNLPHPAMSSAPALEEQKIEQDVDEKKEVPVENIRELLPEKEEQPELKEEQSMLEETEEQFAEQQGEYDGQQQERKLEEELGEAIVEKEEVRQEFTPVLGKKVNLLPERKGEKKNAPTVQEASPDLFGGGVEEDLNEPAFKRMNADILRKKS